MAASATTITGIIRRSMLMVFACALLVGSATFYLFYSAASMDHVEDEARAILRVAVATREYTAEQITPLLAELGDEVFHPEQVPSFAAQSIFRRLAEQNSEYSYREAALNPTNPKDLATVFEADRIERFRGDPALTEAKGIRTVAEQSFFYLARPIAIRDEGCLLCHSTPAAAPPAMRAVYGDADGFGWSMGEIIGVQLLTVPVAQEFKSVYELVAIFFVMLIALFFIVSLTVALPLQRSVIQPLRRLASVADRSSMRDDATDMPTEGASEIQTLARAISRLRTSLNLSIRPPEPPK